MSSKMKAWLVCAFFVAVFSFSVRSSFPRDDLLLQDVDKIIISPSMDYTHANVLRIVVQYMKQAGGTVAWTGGTVQCHCDVYEYHEAATDNEKRGIPVAHVDKTIRVDLQEIEVELPERYFKQGAQGLVECSFDTGTQQLSATQTFKMK
jgi:hypothetical protein